MSDKDAAMRLAIEALALAQRDAQIGEADYAIRALDAALAEPDAKREPATDEQITLKYRLGNYEDSFRDGWREAEWFHGIRKEDGK